MARIADPNRPAAILKAAREVFNETGYTDARMADIARRAGVATGTLYLYYSSKDELVNAICNDYLSVLRDKLQRVVSVSSANEVLEKGVREAFQLARENPDILRVMELRTGLGKRSDPLAADIAIQKLTSAELSRRMTSGEFLPYDPDALALIIGGLVEWSSKACLVWNLGDMDVFEEVVVKLLNNAIRPKRQPAPYYW